MDLEELIIRESCRNTIAQYTHGGDSLRLEDLADAFCEDGVLEVKGSTPISGRRAIIEQLGGRRGSTDDERRVRARAEQDSSGQRRMVRHNIANVHFESVSPTEARVASYFTVFTEIGLDHMGRYRDRMVPDDGRWRIAHRFVSVDWSAPNSRFVV